MDRRRTVLAVVSLLALGACSIPTGPTAIVCPVQTMGCFDAAITVTVDKSSVAVLGVNEDMPTPGYTNRWRYLLRGPSALTRYVGPYREDDVCVGAAQYDGRGGMWIQGGPWRLDLKPTSDAIAARYASMAGVSECRRQRWIVSRAGGSVELLIEEPS